MKVVRITPDSLEVDVKKIGKYHFGCSVESRVLTL